jgi:UDP-N-acetylglucosamine diphosphorylase / glucose-1-phosphate thymidylyltransferase / UDP-N-acetylgalactosamine diphosphorylase / glucosamine-1-phosphate N-acetyltransferase / galactosamine-1-phosphate N-acetyltransferase
MANKFLNDTEALFYPFTLTRNLEDMRIGILTIKEKYNAINESGIKNFLQIPNYFDRKADKMLTNVTDLVFYNSWALQQDFNWITKDRTSAAISITNKVISPHNIFIEEGVVIEHCILNAAEGPIYIGKNALVMEGSCIRGACAICEGAVVKMGTKIYGATTIGPYCVVGGEIKNCIFFGYSNKAHDGYLGDSVVGEWCNFGAGTSNSNLKNNAGEIEIFLEDVALNAKNKFGMLMGDYSRAAINTSFNTGTVVGVCCNIFCDGLTPTAISSFSWGCNGETYQLEKAFVDIENWKKMKNKKLLQAEKDTLLKIYNSK